MFGRRQAGDTSSCIRVREWLPEFDYGIAGYRRRREIAEHLARCPECARELTSLRRAAALVDCLPDHQAPEGLWERIDAALDSPAQQPEAVRAMPPAGRRGMPRRRALLVPLAAAAAAALAVGLGHRPAPEPPQPAQAPPPSYVQAHLALSSMQPLSPGGGLDALALSGPEGGAQ